jgi:DamX protein
MSDANDFFSTTEVSARLDLVRHLIENSEMVPLVRGPSGIGKTLLATKLQQLAPENWLVCHFEADPTMQPERMLATVARCSGLPDITGELLQRLGERFEVLRKRGRVPVLLVDDAHLLPPTSLITLLRLFERQLDGVRLVSIVLFADEQIDLLLSTPQLQVMSPQAIQVIDLPALTRQEATAYMQFLFNNEGLSEKLALDEAKLNRIYRETKGIPGLLAAAMLNAVGEYDSDKRAGAFLTGYKKQLLIGGLPLLLVVLLFIWIASQIESVPESIHDRQVVEKAIEPLPDPATLPQPEIVGPEVAQTETAPPTLPESLVEQSIEMVPEVPVDAVKEPIEMAMGDVASDSGTEDKAPAISTPVVALQPSIPEQIVTPVVESDDRQQQPDLSPPQVADEVDPKTLTENQIKEEATDEAETPKVAEAQKVVEPAKPVEEEVKDAALSWVVSRPANGYTLQLIAVENLDSLKRYIAKNALVGETHTLRLRRNGKPWYALLWGEFPDKNSALKAVSRLPARVQKAGVWPRTFASLQQAIAQQ